MALKTLSKSCGIAIFGKVFMVEGLMKPGSLLMFTGTEVPFRIPSNPTGILYETVGITAITTRHFQNPRKIG